MFPLLAAENPTTALSGLASAHASPPLLHRPSHPKAQVALRTTIELPIPATMPQDLPPVGGYDAVQYKVSPRRQLSPLSGRNGMGEC